MAFYDLSKPERIDLVIQMHQVLESEYRSKKTLYLLQYFADEDTYIRKTAYIETGKIFNSNKELTENIIFILKLLQDNSDFKVRQTVINAAGEIGKTNFTIVEPFFDKGLLDKHHSPRNAVIGSIKKMGEKNPQPILEWAKKYLLHPDKEIRREICHGIELRGRTHPQDILPLLKELQFDKTARVRNTLVHVIGQIAYKKGCLATVVKELLTWENTDLVAEAWIEILVIHERYKNFSVLTVAQAKAYIEKECGIVLDF